MEKKSWDKTNDTACEWMYLFSFPGQSEEEARISLKDKKTAYDWMSGKLHQILPILKEFGVISYFEECNTNRLTKIYKEDVPDMEEYIISYIKETKNINTIEFRLDILTYIPDGNNGWKEHYIKEGAVLTFWFRLNTESEFAFNDMPFASFDLYTEIYNPNPIYSETNNTSIALKNIPFLKKFKERLEAELCLELDDESLLYDPFEQELR